MTEKKTECTLNFFKCPSPLSPCTKEKVKLCKLVLVLQITLDSLLSKVEDKF